jgi:hypothetical protein
MITAFIEYLEGKSSRHRDGIRRSNPPYEFRLILLTISGAGLLLGRDYLDRDLVLLEGWRVMFRDHVNYQSRTGLLHSRDRRDHARRSEFFGWMLLVVLAFNCILSFFL